MNTADILRAAIEEALDVLSDDEFDDSRARWEVEQLLQDALEEAGDA